MRLEATLVGHDNVTGIAQLQTQLVTLALQMQEVVKGKEVRPNVRCKYVIEKDIVRMSAQS